MKIAIITDLHIVSPDEPLTEIRNKRLFFADAWPTFQQLTIKLKQESPDLVICLGDMVDWYSRANRDFALYLLDKLPCSWVSVPGNHDYESYAANANGIRNISATDGQAAAVNGWLESRIELHNRYIDAGDTGLILLDSAVSSVPEGTKEWLRELKGRHLRQLLFTHVPLDLPATRNYISSVEPNRDLNKYVQSKAPWVFDDCLQGGTSHVFTGHLHFTGDLDANGTRLHMLGMSITDLRKQGQPAAACIVHLGRNVEIRRISLES
jgi:predicted phosphodiesterase